MNENSNLNIVKRLALLSQNQVEYNEFPRAYNEEYIFLANWLNSAARDAENDFNKTFQYAVGNYKSTLKESGKGYGWFHNAGNLVHQANTLDQIHYAIYGERHIRGIRWNAQLKNMAYKDLIEQIDRTVLMTEAQLKKHRATCNKLAKKIMDEILAEEKKEQKIK